MKGSTLVVLVPRIHMVYGTFTCPTCTRYIGVLVLIIVPCVHVVYLSSLNQIVICLQTLRTPSSNFGVPECLPLGVIAFQV